MSNTQTNIKNLPQPFVDAISFSDFHPAGQLSVKKLIDAAQIAYLRRHNNIPEEVSEKVWTLISNSLLQVIENGSESHRARRAFSTVIAAVTSIQAQEMLSIKDEVREEAIATLIGNLDALLQQYYPPTDRFLIRQSYGLEFEETYTSFKGTPKEHTATEKITIFDTIPLYDKEAKILYVPKICNTFHATKSDMRQHWVRESNMQAYILIMNGLPVEKIEVMMVFKDFTAARIGDKDYPKSQTEAMILPLHQNKDIEKVIHIQLKKHLRALKGDVAPCTHDERWAENDTWIVKSPAVTRPHKAGLQTKEEAEAWAGANRVRFMNAQVEPRKGKSKRCMDYCPVRGVCPQWITQQREAATQEAVKSE